MDKKEFDKWYRENIGVMAKLGVFHPESQSGKTVHLAVASVRPEILMLHERINRIEQMIQNLENVSDENKEKLKIPVKQIKMTVESFESEDEPKVAKKKVEKPKKEARRKPEPKSSTGGWQINKR